MFFLLFTAFLITNHGFFLLFTMVLTKKLSKLKRKTHFLQWKILETNHKNMVSTTLWSYGKDFLKPFFVFVSLTPVFDIWKKLIPSILQCAFKINWKLYSNASVSSVLFSGLFVFLCSLSLVCKWQNCWLELNKKHVQIRAFQTNAKHWTIKF